MLGLSKNTVENLVILMAGVLLFNGVVNIQTFGQFLKENPFVIIGLAIGLLIFKDKIANKLGR